MYSRFYAEHRTDELHVELDSHLKPVLDVLRESDIECGEFFNEK